MSVVSVLEGTTLKIIHRIILIFFHYKIEQLTFKYFLKQIAANLTIVFS